MAQPDPARSASQFPAVHHPHCNALCDGESHWLGATRSLPETERMRAEMLGGSAPLDVLPTEGRTGVRGQVIDGDVLP